MRRASRPRLLIHGSRVWTAPPNRSGVVVSISRCVHLGRIVSLQTSSERGGAEYASVDLLAALQSSGHDVIFLTNLADLGRSAGLRVRYIDLGPKLSRETTGSVLRSAPRAVWRIARALRAERPVAVTLLHFKKEQLLCALLPHRLTGRVVWAEWGPVPEPLRAGLPRLLYALAARRVTRVLAVSAGTRDSIVAAGVPATRISVVPNVLPVDRLHFDHAARDRLRAEWGVRSDTFVIGCISRFQRRKRLDVAIDAIGHLDGDVLLVLAGEGETESELRQRAAAHKGRVRFVASPPERVHELLSACDALVFTPSPTEGAPRVIAEAQLVGVPVIATDRPGAEGLIRPGEGTVVSPSNDPRATAGVLAAYRDDPARRAREADRARARAVRDYSPRRIVATVEDLLTSA
jgi:glycosyltransferase involved in cell wall biosynthesis